MNVIYGADNSDLHGDVCIKDDADLNSDIYRDLRDAAVTQVASGVSQQSNRFYITCLPLHVPLLTALD